MNILSSPLLYQENKMLKEVCTFGIGGPARYYTEVKTIDEMRCAFEFCKNRKTPFFILGKGSNSLFHDNGFDGLVIANKIDFFENPSPGIYHIGSGYSFSLLGVQTAKQNWSGLEFASGIPCTVGGAVYMNAGASGADTSQCLATVDFLTSEGLFKVLTKKELEFNYRYSSFQKMNGSIVGATFKLIKNPEARVKQLEMIAYRTKTQPYGEKSAGCVFRNPECGRAGALIEKANLKGISCGGASVSHLHANFIVNKGKASCQDVLNLIEIIKQKVKAHSGIELEIEIRSIPNR
jgi:UDP-N-acetylmuramate dehydrogenase